MYRVLNLVPTAARALQRTTLKCVQKSNLLCKPGRSLSSQVDLWGSPLSVYDDFTVDSKIALKKRLEDKNRFQTISQREDRSDTPVEAIKAQCMGKYFLHHRGCQLLQSPYDMVIGMELLWNLRPATVIELGTYTGASALWMADMLRLMEIESKIFSIDINTSNLDDRVKKLKPDNLIFLEGDCYEIEKHFPKELLQTLPHPWLIVDDAHENIYGFMNYFRQSGMATGDYFVVEDLSADIPSVFGSGAIYDEEYEPAGTEMLNDLKRFLTDYSEEFAVDSFYTDLFGYNGTWHWHGYIRKM